MGREHDNLLPVEEPPPRTPEGDRQRPFLPSIGLGHHPTLATSRASLNSPLGEKASTTSSARSGHILEPIREAMHIGFAFTGTPSEQIGTPNLGVPPNDWRA